MFYEKNLKLIIGLVVIIVIIVIGMVIVGIHTKEQNNKEQSNSDLVSIEDLDIALQSPKCVIAYNNKIQSEITIYNVYIPIENNKFKKINKPSFDSMNLIGISKVIALKDNELIWLVGDKKIYDCTTGNVIDNLEEFNNHYNGNISLLGKDDKFVYYKEIDRDNYVRFDLDSKEFSTIKKEDVPQRFLK